MALASPELDVRGITIVAGNAPLEMGYGNARKVLHFLGREDVPVYLGADRPLKRDYVNALDTHGADGLGESFLPDVPVALPPTKTAMEFMREELRAGGCSIIALGPLTNLAELIRVDRDAFLTVDELVSMGGNYRSHGNCSPVAEYNYWEDPDSARIVYQTLEDYNASCPLPNTELRSMPTSAQVPCGASDATGISTDLPQRAVSNPAADIGRGEEKRPKYIRMVGLDVTRKIVLTPTLLEYIERLHPEVVVEILVPAIELAAEPVRGQQDSAETPVAAGEHRLDHAGFGVVPAQRDLFGMHGLHEQLLLFAQLLHRGLRLPLEGGERLRDKA